MCVWLEGSNPMNIDHLQMDLGGTLNAIRACILILVILLIIHIQC